MNPCNPDRSLIEEALPELVALRHEMHAHPQTAYEETYASALVVRELKSLGIEHVAGLAGGTGVVGWIVPGDPEAAARPATALRADMDALPITEETGLPYAAGPQYQGSMHACGHDGHTTMLLGAARVLAAMRDRLVQPVKLLFQPAEETGGGAARMVDDGALDERTGNLRAARIYGQHNWPRVERGGFALCAGPMMAATQPFAIEIQGHGGHAAIPQNTRDPLLAGAQLVTALQSVVSRNVAPTQAAVLSVTAFQAGNATNVIASEAMLRGTMRHLDPAVGKLLHRRLEEIARDVCGAMGCKATVHFEQGYPPTINDAALSEVVRKLAGQASLQEVHGQLPVMGAEDFSFYGEKIPAVFMFLGSGDDGEPVDLHTPQYDFNDTILCDGIEMMVRFALERIPS